MTLRSAWMWGNASWREAVRLREPFLDVDHLLLGLVGLGGPAARLLGRHGFTLVAGRRAAALVSATALASLGVEAASLPAVDPVPVGDLHAAASGHAPMAPRAERLRKTLQRRSTERDYLAAVVDEPSGTVLEVLERAGVDIGALVVDLADPAGDWSTHAPRGVHPSTPAGRGRRLASLRLEHWIAAPSGVVQAAASDLTTPSRWLSAEEAGLRVLDGRHETRVDTGVAGGPMELVLTSAQSHHVCWEMWWGQRYGGSHTFDLAPLDSGTLVVHTREITTFGRFAATMPLVRFATGLGMPSMVQNLSFACADLVEMELP